MVFFSIEMQIYVIFLETQRRGLLFSTTTASSYKRSLRIPIKTLNFAGYIINKYLKTYEDTHISDAVTQLWADCL